MATYEREAEYLLAAYRRAVGLCLQYGIKVYVPGGGERALGSMLDDVFVHRMRYGLDIDGQPVPYNEVLAYQRHLKAHGMQDHQVDYFKQPKPGMHVYNPAHTVFYSALVGGDGVIGVKFTARLRDEIEHLRRTGLSPYLNLTREMKEHQ